MAKRDFYARHRIVRGAIKSDLLYFALPALFLFTTGLVVAMLDGWDGWLLANTTRSAAGQRQLLITFSLPTILGLALVLTGYIFLFTGRFTLRRFYSSTLIIREDHRLITHGIYRYTRHPIYLGLLLVAFGLPIFAHSLLGFLTMLALVPIVLYRIKMEENLLAAQFGEAYRAYAAATAKLIPFLY